MPNANTPQDTTEPSRAAPSASDRAAIGQSHCLTSSASCDSDRGPAGDLFLRQSEINPRRRIVRARRPPPVRSNVPVADATSGGDDYDEDASADAAALVSDDNSERRSGNDGAPVAYHGFAGDDYDEDSPDLSDAIELLRQLNGERNSGNGAIAVGNDGASLSNPMRSGHDDGNSDFSGDGRLRMPPMEYFLDDDEEEAEAEAEDSDDDGSFAPPSQFFEDFLSHMSEMSRRNASRRPRQNLSTNIRPDDDEEESDYDDEYHGSTDVRCAACYRSDDRNHTWRRLVTLPCCGTNGREANSSTRFCAACILRLAVTRPTSSHSSEYHLYDDEPDEYPVRKFYEKNVQTENRRFCECPRCRDILLVKIKGVKPTEECSSDDESSDNECDCSDCAADRRERNSDRDFKTAKSVSLQVPSFRAKCWYIGRKRGVAKILWKVALLHHNFMPFEALGREEEKGIILRLSDWGVIEKVPGKRKMSLYRIDKGNQTKLIKLFRLKNASEKDKKSECLLISDVGPCLLYAAWRHLWDEYRIDRSLRMLNRFFFLGLHFLGYLPPLPLSWRQELVATTLILFSATLVAQFLCVFIVYAATLFGVGILVCYVLKRSNNIKSCWWQAILLPYLAYKLNKWFYESPLLSWGTLISPKAVILVKKIVWG